MKKMPLRCPIFLILNEVIPEVTTSSSGSEGFSLSLGRKLGIDT